MKPAESAVTDTQAQGERGRLRRGWDLEEPGNKDTRQCWAPCKKHSAPLWGESLFSFLFFSGEAGRHLSSRPGSQKSLLCSHGVPRPGWGASSLGTTNKSQVPLIHPVYGKRGLLSFSEMCPFFQHFSISFPFISNKIHAEPDNVPGLGQHADWRDHQPDPAVMRLRVQPEFVCPESGTTDECRSNSHGCSKRCLPWETGFGRQN